MERATFDKMLSLLLTGVESDGARALRSFSGRVDPDARLALSLRLLAGKSYLEFMMLFGISRSTIHTVLHATSDSILSCLNLSGLPFENIIALSVLLLCRGFGSSCARVKPLVGCVGALDGITITISKKMDCYIPRDHYCRKGFYENHRVFRRHCCTRALRPRLPEIFSL